MRHLKSPWLHLAFRLFLVAIFTLGIVSSIQSQSLEVLNDQDNDAYLDIRWTIPQSCLTNSMGNAYANGVFLELLGDGERVYTQIIETKRPEDVDDRFRHYIGPDSSVTYTLNLYIQGPGTALEAGCTGFTDSGETLPFQAPSGITALGADNTDKVELEWTNNSKLSSNFVIVRKEGSKETVVDIIAGTDSIGLVIEYVDDFSFTNPKSLKNGIAYQYCIRTSSDLVDSLFAEDNHNVCLVDSVSTYDIGLTATDNAFVDKVSLAWNDVSDYASLINILRDGARLTTLPATATSFVDVNPVYGLESEYAVVLIGEDGLRFVQDLDGGGVDPIGHISGYVRTSQGIGIRNVKVGYEVTVFDSVYVDSTTTNREGYYSFDQLFFGRRANFRLYTEEKENIRFPTSPRFTSLSDDDFNAENVNFLADFVEQDLPRPVVIDTVIGGTGIDSVYFDISYAPDSFRTTYFQLYREGNLVAIANDRDGQIMRMSDLGGNPREFYRYNVFAYRINGDSTATDLASATIQYPDVEDPVNVSTTTSFSTSTMGAVTLEWEHNSTNFAGFVIYRDSVEIKTIRDTSIRHYTDFEGSPGEVYRYGVSAFRSIGGEAMESDIIEEINVAYPSFPQVTGLSATPVASANAMDLTWSLGAGAMDDNYTGFIIYRDAVEIGRVLKGAPLIFRDQWGVPGSNPYYEVAPFVENIDSVFVGSSEDESGTYPNLAAPTGFAAVGGSGSIAFSWNDLYNISQYTNFHGFILRYDGNTVVLEPGATELTIYPLTDATINASLTAFRMIDGTLYESTQVTTSANATITIPSALEKPGNLSVSTNIPTHIALTWTYPEYKFSTFIIRRDGVPIDTVPKGALGYYDYDTEVGETHEYSVQARYEESGMPTLLSQEIKGYGVRRNQARILGHLTHENGDLAELQHLEVTLNNGDTVLARTYTDPGGFFRFEELPEPDRQNELQVIVNQTNKSISLAQDTFPINNTPYLERDTMLLVLDTFLISDFPPRPLRDSIAQIISLTAQPFDEFNGVYLSWTLNDGLYDRVEILRGLNEIGFIEDGEPAFFLDTTAVPGFGYTYILKPVYDIDENNRIDGESQSITITHNPYPTVENLTASFGYFGADNAVGLNWSFPRLSDVDFYQISRNDEVIGLVEADKESRYEDKDGKPTSAYVYQIRAFKQRGTRLIQSEPVEVRLNYPAIADPVNLSVVSVPDTNGVRIAWEYIGEYVDAFRVFRDDELLSVISADSAYLYYDFFGIPEQDHEYRVVAVRADGDMNYQSVGALGIETFPPLLPVQNPTIQAQADDGNIRLTFTYDDLVVDSFEIRYNLTVAPAIDTTFIIGLSIEDLDEDGFLEYIDELTPNGYAQTYSIYTVANRDGMRYLSVPVVQSSTVPETPTPQNFTATDGTYDNLIRLTWALNFEATVDYLELTIDGGSTIILDGGIREYNHIINQQEAGVTSHSYSLRAVREVYGTTFPSTTVSETGYAGIDQRPGGAYNVSALSELGYSVSMSGTSALAGAPNSYGGNGAVVRFNYDGTRWTDAGITTKPGSASGNFGTDIDILENIAMVGAPGAGGFSETGSVVVYNYSGGSLSSANTVPFSSVALSSGGGVFYDYSSVEYGKSVALAKSSTGFFTGYSPGRGTRKTTQSNGSMSTGTFYEVYALRSSGTNSSFYLGSRESGGEQIFSTSGSGDYVAFGKSNKVDIFKKDTPGGISNTALVTLSGTGNFGREVFMTNKFLVVGAPAENRVFVYVRDGDEFNEIKVLSIPEIAGVSSSGANFGFSVSINNNYLLVGAPYHASPSAVTTNQGAVFVYEVAGEAINYITFISNPDLTSSAKLFGYDVTGTEDQFMIGAPILGGQGSVYFYSSDLSELWGDKITNLRASDGLLPGRVQVSWDFNGSAAALDGFKVYRDDVLIGETGKFATTFFDSDGIPGKEYVYTVRPFVGEEISNGKADVGYGLPNGLIEGDVVTLTGNAPVRDVIVEATAVVDGQKYTYRDTTDGNGHFFMSEIFYSNIQAEYTVTVSFEDHVFLEDTKTVQLSRDDNKESSLFFFDQTAYVIQGNIAYQDVKCGLDSIKVSAISRFTGGRTTRKEAYSDENGDYSLVVDPALEDLLEIRVEIQSMSVSQNLDSGDQDTIRHEFAADGQTLFTDLDNFEQLNILNFRDTLTYEAEFLVTTVCGGPASNGNFIIEVSTKDGCYNERFTTTTGGVAKAKLPPLDDLNILVKDVQQNNILNLLIVDYLKYRPDTLNLRRVHVQNANDDLTEVQIGNLIDRNLVYHRPANISLQTPFGEYLCDAPDVGIIRRDDLDDEVNLSFNVTELFDGLSCPVQEGYLIINNSAAKENTKDTLEYSEVLQGFPTHIFEPGEPNLVAPFRRGINVKYYSKIGDLLGEVIFPVVIEGSSSLPGADIIVDISDSDGQLKLPYMILRDPPGDGSFSTIEEGTTITKTYRSSESSSFGGGVLASFQGAIVSVGAFADVSIKGGTGSVDAREFSLESTLTESISTSNTSDFIGENSDVIVGVGSATAYTINESIVYDPSVCSLSKVQNFALSPGTIKTQWSYTVGQIKDIVSQLTVDTTDYLTGAKVLYNGTQPLTPSEAVGQTRARLENWKEVLSYHKEKTVPYFAFCSEDYDEAELFEERVRDGYYELVRKCADSRCNSYVYEVERRFDESDNKSSILEVVLGNQESGLTDEQESILEMDIPSSFTERVTKATQARNGFCATIGTSPGASFELNSSVDWTDNLVGQYEVAVSKVAYWLDSLQYSNNQVNSEVSDLNESSPGYLSQVKNYTFSAGVDIEVSESVTKSQSSSYTQTSYFNFDLSAGFYFKSEIGIGGGLAGPFSKIAENEGKLGGQIELALNTEDEKTFQEEVNTNITYVLSDDDPGDQFSVTVFKPVQTGHSPYFQLLGGRSSCPPEAGTIYRDRYEIAIFDTATQAAFNEFSFENLDPGTPATFYLQITNLNPFGEARDIYLYVDASTNENGAVIESSGQKLTGGNQGGGITLTYLGANQPLLLPISVTRSPNNFQFEDIDFIIRPSCTDGDLFVSIPRDGSIAPDTVSASFVFESPCTDIKLVGPDDDWLITRRNPFINGDREDLVVELIDYDPDNAVLEEIVLQSRQIGTGAGWNDVSALEINIPDNPVRGYQYPMSKDSLVIYNALNFAVDQVPKLFFTWDITEDFIGDDVNYPDGTYEIRAVAKCGTTGEVFSESSRGRIIRNSGGVFAQLEPSDQLYTLGDEISAVISKEINCNDVNDETNIVEVFRKSDSLAVPGTVACFPNLDKLIFQPTDISAFDGDTLVFKLKAIKDENGIIYPDSFQTEFLVLTRDLFVEDTEFSAEVYKGTTLRLQTRAFANSMAPVPFEVDVHGESWVTVTPQSSSVLPGSDGRILELALSTDNLSLGDTTATITVRSTSGTPSTNTIVINLRVLAKAPYWELDPSQYTQSMAMNLNYEFISLPGIISQDTMDQISVWIDEEIRGVSPILVSSNGAYATFNLVYGDPADVGKELEFRIWDASAGREYNGYPTVGDTIRFDPNVTLGTFLNPEIVYVNKSRDRARYIPLNGNGSWTLFSINSEETDMRTDQILRSLTMAQEGDLIKTRTQSAIYTEGAGWLANSGPSGLDTIEVEDGFQIYLQGPDDTLRVTGANAAYGIIPLRAGWNLIGYPLQTARPINDVLQITNISQGDNIRTVAQDGAFSNMVAFYDNIGSGLEWVGLPAVGMDVLRPFFAYQVFLQNDGTLLYPGATLPPPQPLSGNASLRSGQSPSVMDPETWVVETEKYPTNMVITGLLEVDGSYSMDPDDRIAAFVNGTCRGVSPLYEVDGMDPRMATLFVYGFGANDTIDIVIYDASENEVYYHDKDLVFSTNDIIGTFGNPYVFKPVTKRVDYALHSPLCTTDSTGLAVIEEVKGMKAPYSVRWSTGEEGPRLEGVLAGNYALTITDARGLELTDEVELDPQNVTITPPVIQQGRVQAVCFGNDLQLRIDSTQPPGATYQWFVDGEAVTGDHDLTLTNIQQTRWGTVITKSKGCYSTPTLWEVSVYQPSADFRVIATDTLLTVGESLVFEPDLREEGARYVWNFGDGHTSTDPVPVHEYEQPGTYYASLQVTDSTGCLANETRPLLVTISTGDELIPGLEIDWKVSPNPFIDQLRLSAKIEEAGKYQIQVLTLAGQEVLRRTYSWHAGTNEETIVPEVPNGTYFVRLTRPGHAGGLLKTVIKQSPKP